MASLPKVNGFSVWKALIGLYSARCNTTYRITICCCEMPKPLSLVSHGRACYQSSENCATRLGPISRSVSHPATTSLWSCDGSNTYRDRNFCSLTMFLPRLNAQNRATSGAQQICFKFGKIGLIESLFLSRWNDCLLPQHVLYALKYCVFGRRITVDISIL